VFLLLLLLHRLTLIIFREKNGKIVVFFSQKRSSNQCKTDHFLAKFAQKIPTKSAVFTDRFWAKFPLKFSANFPRNRPFFPRICNWKSLKIWLFSATYQKPWKKFQKLKFRAILFQTLFISFRTNFRQKLRTLGWNIA